MRVNLNKISDRIICGASKKIMQVPTCRPLREAGIESCGIATLMAPYHLTRDGAERPFHYSAWFVLAGEFEMEIPGRSIDLTPGMFFLIPSWLPRSIKLVSGDEQSHLSFTISLADAPEELQTDHAICRRSMTVGRLKHAVEGLIEEANALNPSALVSSHYCELILHFLKQDVQGRDTQLDETHLQLSDLLQNIKNRLNERWSVGRMASDLFISRAQLFRIMKRYYHTTPNSFLQSERTALASRLLIETDYSLDIIAEQVGYANQYTFSNVFLKQTGIRPGGFRKQKT